MIDFRSDTLTRPTDAMREAMATAEVGDDVYGEDPTVNLLEERTADLLGLEAGLFCPTGSLANMLGVASLVSPGTEVLADHRAHILRAEMGGHGALAGVTSRTWVAEGPFRAAHATALMMSRADAGDYLVGTAAVAVENTLNFGGGSVIDFAELQALRAATRDAGIAVHMDGARLANAAVATGTPLSAFGGVCDTISICLSKGLGAPVGSVLAGPAELIARARILRKRYGGGMRQVGILAAAGLFALENNIARLAEDHEKAQVIARAAHAAHPGVVSPEAVETNIVLLDTRPLRGTAADLARAAEAEGIRVSTIGADTVRIITHLDVSAEDAATAAQVLSELIARFV